jgi:hypothetical protein
MNDITLTVFNLKKSEANAIVKAMNKLVELGQIENKHWAMNTDEISELDSNLMRETKKTNKKAAPKKITQEMVRKALKDISF